MSLKRGRGWAIRRRELGIAPDGTIRRTLRYEALGSIARGEAAEILKERMAAAGNGKAPTRSRVTFQALAGEWRAHVLPMYKRSTQKIIGTSSSHRHILEKHLLLRFGEKPIGEVILHVTSICRRSSASMAQVGQQSWYDVTPDGQQFLINAIRDTWRRCRSPS